MIELVLASILLLVLLMLPSVLVMMRWMVVLVVLGLARMLTIELLRMMLVLVKLCCGTRCRSVNHGKVRLVIENAQIERVLAFLAPQ